MEQRDLIVTPLVLMLVYTVAYIVRPLFTDDITRRYFIPGLTVRIIGALAVGFIYQFYYGGGDTFTYHTNGSRVIWEAFMDDPSSGLDLLFSNGQHHPESFKYSQKIWSFNDPSSFFVIRVAALFDLLTFSSYSATAVLFAVVSFLGAWLFFQTFYELKPEIHRWIAVASLFVPTVFFWGSGIFKDTLTLAALGAAMYFIYQIFVKRNRSLVLMVLLLLSLLVIFIVKKYVLLCFMPVALFWMFSRIMARIKSHVVKVLLVPVTIMPVLFLIYYVVYSIGEDDSRYNVDAIAKTAQITAYDIRYGWGARTGEGSGYTLGELDGTWQSMLRLTLPAINVSLFRPYLWEVRNPLMLMSAIEGLVFLIGTLYVLWTCRRRLFRYALIPEIVLCLGFALVFAFAVGISTFNFGTLSRYKIPMEPFYLVGLTLLYHYSKSERNRSEFDATE